VNLLNQPDTDAVTDDIGTLPSSAPLFSPDEKENDAGDLRSMHGEHAFTHVPAKAENVNVNVSVSEMLYGHDGTLHQPVNWRMGNGEGVVVGGDNGDDGGLPGWRFRA